MRAVQRERLIGSVPVMWDCGAGDGAAQEGRFVPAEVFPQWMTGFSLFSSSDPETLAPRVRRSRAR